MEKEGERVNTKSIMGIMILAAAKGTKLIFYTESHKQEKFRAEAVTFSSKFSGRIKIFFNTIKTFFLRKGFQCL